MYRVLISLYFGEDEENEGGYFVFFNIREYEYEK